MFFKACCTKIICVLLAYCMVTLWQVILYFDRFSRATFNVMKIGLGKQLLAKVYPCKMPATNILFLYNMLKNFDLKKTSFYTCF